VSEPRPTALQRYAAHRVAGEAEAALNAASDACHDAPLQAESHYAYGEAWTALGQHAHAARAFAEAVRLAPRWADAWVNFGVARYRVGDIVEAKQAMHRAMRLAPDHPAPVTNLAAFMRISGETDAAETLLRDSIARAPANPGARLNLVADLLHEERSAEALALLDGAPAVPVDPPTKRHWHLQRSLALLQLGRTAEVPAELDHLAGAPAEIMPLVHWRHLLLAQSRNDHAIAAREAVTMAKALETMGPRGVPEHRIMAHYDLAKFWSARNDHAAAFAHWRTGHALLRESQPFSRETLRGFVDANIDILTRDRFIEGPRAANNDPSPVFIVGMPRSGTTLCEQIIAAHAEGHGAGERAALPWLFSALGGADATSVTRIAALNAATLDARAAAYLEQLHALAPYKTRIVDKMPGNYMYLGFAALLLPSAKFIHCERDPRDIGLSIFTFRFHGGHGYAHDLGDLGWTIAQQIRLMAHWKAVLPGRVLTVRLTDWITDFHATLKRVLAHLDLPYDPACERFHEAGSRVRTVSRAQVRQPVNARGIGRWRRYARDLAPLIAELDAAGALAGWDDLTIGS
jgi:Tfp pilus assembly protein PilF